MVEYVHMPYESVFERTRLIDLAGGVAGGCPDEPKLRRDRMEGLLREREERQP